MTSEFDLSLNFGCKLSLQLLDCHPHVVINWDLASNNLKTHCQRIMSFRVWVLAPSFVPSHGKTEVIGQRIGLDDSPVFLDSSRISLCPLNLSMVWPDS